MKFIFQVQIKEGKTIEDYKNAWRTSSEIIQKSEGAQGTILYQNLKDPSKLVAIATWESKEARDAAMPKIRETYHEIHDKHEEFGDIKVLGYFEELTRVEPESKPL